MRCLFATPIVATFFLFSVESAAQGLPPAPPAPPSPVAPTAAPPAAPDAPVPPSATPPPPGPEVAPPGPSTPPPPPGGAGAMPPGLGTPPPPPGGAGQTTIPQGSPTPQPYPYPYYPQPYYGRGYPQGWRPQPAPKMKTEWYGWQTLIGVLSSDAITFAGALTNGGPFAYIGIAGHVLTGPIVHWAHGHVGKGFLSLGMNLGLPAIGTFTGALIADNDFGGIFVAFTLGGIGYILGPTLDMAILSTEQVPEMTTTVPKGARLLLPTSVGFAPMLDQNRRGLMLVGQF